MQALGNVLITGGASGLGAATATAVAEAGGRPMIIDRAVGVDEDFPYARADLADRSQAESAVHRLAGAESGIDAVFTAAGVDSCGALDDVPAEEWDRVIRVNLMGTAAVVRAALPYLKERGGAVVTCSSTLGLRAVNDATAYSASKFGVIGFTRALAAETAGQVRVTLLVPGGMHTAFFDGRSEQYRPPADAKLNQPEHVAQAVLFALRRPAGCEVRELVVCASEEASWP